MTPPPRSVVGAFGGAWPPELLGGGEGRSWRAGDIVLKPLDRSVEELEWQAGLLARVRGEAFRLPSSVRTAEGALNADGWYATAFLTGRHEPGRWPDIIRVGEAFHAAIATERRPAFLDRRTDPWAIGDRVAWGDLPVSDFADSKHVARLAAARRPLDASDQLIHGDLTGNVLFAEGLPPAIIDLSPYWRPAPFAAAVVVADALVWEGADVALVAQIGHIDRFEPYLVRALIYRAITDWIIRSGDAIRADHDDSYLPVVEIAIELCDQAEASRQPSQKPSDEPTARG